MKILEKEELNKLFEALSQQAYEVIAPTVRDGAIIYETVSSVKDLPIGWTEEQDAGTYRLKKREDDAYFGFTVGPQSWKKFLFPPRLRLWQAERSGQDVHFKTETAPTPKYAIFGARACELHAIAIQDKVFMGGSYVDPSYRSRRENLFIVAVQCSVSSKTCFCVSMNTGPKVTKGFDLALTEVIGENDHHFVVEVGSERGEAILNTMSCRDATNEEIDAASAIVAKTAEQMGRHLKTEGIKELLYQNVEHPVWDDIARRCLSCANCTMVCPTCFCSTVEDTTDLTRNHAERWRRWDSCFTMDFSYIHGGHVRSTPKSRFRQWMTHKLAAWHDQFGTSGCVGCGRCITWCPVGIDITEVITEVAFTS